MAIIKSHKSLFRQFTGTSSSQITFKGSIDTAISNTNGSGLKVYWCWFGENGNTTQQVTNGIYCKNSDGSDFENNKFRYCDKGLQYYMDGGSNNTLVKQNHFYYNNMGLVAAPAQNPNTTSAVGANGSANSLDMTIQCNKFDYNTVGIFGYGNLIAQGNNAANGQAGNTFNYDTDWDWFWDYGTTPNINVYNSAFNGVNNSKPNYYLNGNNINNFAHFTYQTGTSDPACAGFTIQSPFFVDPVSNNNETKNIDVSVFPNPFSNEFNIKITGIDWISNIVICDIYDITGRKIESKRLTNEQSSFVLNESFAQGVYMASIKQNGTLIKKQKLVKTTN